MSQWPGAKATAARQVSTWRVGFSGHFEIERYKVPTRLRFVLPEQAFLLSCKKSLLVPDVTPQTDPAGVRGASPH
jgi:hypothetical protein